MKDLFYEYKKNVWGLMLFGLLGLGFNSHAASLTIAGATATLGVTHEMPLTITLALGNGEAISALQFDIQYDSRQLALNRIDVGVATEASGKQVRYTNLNANTVRVIIYGINHTSIPSGVIAIPNFKLASLAQVGVTPLKFFNPWASAATAIPVTTGVADGAITIVALAAVEGISNARAYPSPFQPSLGHARIFFGPLTMAARIKIFKLNGALLKDIQHKGNGLAEWDGKNEAGMDLASGVYIYAITNSNGERKGGKLVILR